MSGVLETDKVQFKGYKALLFALLAVLLILPVLRDHTYFSVVIGFLFVGVLLTAVRAVAQRRNQFLLSGVLGCVRSGGGYPTDRLGSFFRAYPHCDKVGIDRLVISNETY